MLLCKCTVSSSHDSCPQCELEQDGSQLVQSGEHEQRSGKNEQRSGEKEQRSGEHEQRSGAEWQCSSKRVIKASRRSELSEQATEESERWTVGKWYSSDCGRHRTPNWHRRQQIWSLEAVSDISSFASYPTGHQSGCKRAMERVEECSLIYLVSGTPFCAPSSLQEQSFVYTSCLMPITADFLDIETIWSWFDAQNGVFKNE